MSVYMDKYSHIKIPVLSAVISLLVGAGIGWYAHDCRLINFIERRVKLGGFQFISPLLDVELPEGYTVYSEPIPFKHIIARYVDQQIKSGNVLEMSVYYRDLSDGPWFGINEKVKYTPASMMKVPIMIAWLKRAEKDPAILRRKLSYNEKAVVAPPQTLRPTQTLKSGGRYTVEELLHYMMAFSDNKAMKLLSADMPYEEIINVVRNMDVANDPGSDLNEISIHSYSGFLRILYNASFLSKEMSELALKMMSYQEFPQGIAAGIPPGIKLASKFGEYWLTEHPGRIQLHEFGIVYHPKGPYILGVLTRGHNWKEQADIISTVSELVYNSVNTSMPR